jgi:hypothetical protein
MAHKLVVLPMWQSVFDVLQNVDTTSLHYSLSTITTE